jgi:hypothetical protein
LTADDVTSQGDHSPISIPGAITWKGHDFIDTVRTEKVWSKVKTELKNRAITLPFSLVQDLAIKIAKSYIDS